MASRPVEPDQGHLDARPAWPHRVGLGVVLAVAAVVFTLRGVPLDNVQVYLWILFALAGWSVGRPWWWIRRALVQWVPFLGLLVLYQLGYGVAGRFFKAGEYPVEGEHNVIGIGLHVRWPVRADEWLFGGTLPNEWAQSTFHAHGMPWFAWIVTLVYCSHFVVAPVAALVLWIRGSALFRPWLGLVLGLAACGLTCYFLFPMAPPWLASQQGALGGGGVVERYIGEGWEQLSFTTAESLLGDATAMSNPVAAMPSLHMATATLAAIVLPWQSRPWVRVVAFLYPALMAFTLIYGGEHYVVDELAGVTLAVLLVTAWRLTVRRAASERRHESRQVEVSPAESPEP